MKIRKLAAYKDIFLTVIIWGAASVVIKQTLSGISPLSFLTYRFFISSIIALAFLPSIFSLFNKKSNTVLLILLYALISGPVALGILFVGLEDTNVSTLSIITAVQPVLIAFLGSLMFHDRLTKRVKLGLAISVCGVFLTISESIFSQSLGVFTGNAMILLYVLFDTAAVFILKVLLKRNVSPTALTHLSFMVGFLCFFPLVAATTTVSGFLDEIVNLPFWYHVGVFYMAIISGTIAYSLRGKAQKTLSVSEVSFFSYLTPIISTILAIIFLGEHISIIYVLGSLLVAVGIITLETRRLKL